MKHFAMLLCLLVLGAATPHACIGCSFQGSDLHGADFRNVRYVGTNFEGTNLRDARFGGAELVGCNLRRADLRGADLGAATLTGCNLSGALLGGARLDGMKAVGARLDDAHAQGVRFRDVNLIGASFVGANLTDADFAGAVVCWQNDRWREASDRGDERIGCIDLAGARVQGTSFRGALICSGGHFANAPSCVPVDARTLRMYSRSALQGAIL